MAGNSYGFDFLKSEHKLSGENGSDYYSTNGIGGPISSSSIDDDVSKQNDSNSLQMDDESFRQREMMAMNKPALEKQFDILAFLQKHTRRTTTTTATSSNGDATSNSSSTHHNSHCLPPNIIYRATGIDLQNDTVVHTMLQNNPKVKIEYIPDPENPTLLIPHYAYQAKYPNVVDRLSLIGQINRMRDTGISMIRDLYDCYSTIEYDIQQCIISGDIIAISNNDDRDKILFPRGDTFLVELDGIITIPDEEEVEEEKPLPNDSTTSTATNSMDNDPLLNGNQSSITNGSDVAKNKKFKEIYFVDTDIDPRKQIRRGEAVQVGGQWFRVSSAIKAGVPLSEQPVRAQAPLSVVSYTDLSSRNEVDGYIRTFTNKLIPLDDTLTEVAQNNIRSAKLAREKLMKLGQTIFNSNTGTSGGVRHNSNSTSAIIGQLTSSYAHASNPTKLAATITSSSTTSAQQQHHGGGNQLNRKRPNVSSLSYNAPHSQQHQQQRSSSNSIVSTKVELEKAASDPSIALYNHARRHGCTKDIRDMYFATRKFVPESDHDLQKILIEHKLLEPNELMRRPRLMVKNTGSNVDNDGKPKKRRYYERKNQRMTNTHLEGTEIGALLALAAEKQKQGKSVGDGGM